VNQNGCFRIDHLGGFLMRIAALPSIVGRIAGFVRVRHPIATPRAGSHEFT